MLTQKELFQQRLAERKKARGSSSVTRGLNNTLPLGKVESLDDMEAPEVRKSSGQQGVIQTSSLPDSQEKSKEGEAGYQGTGPNISPEKPSNNSTGISLMNITSSLDQSDQKSCNRSTTTAGGGIASKILGNISRILQSSGALETDEDDIGDLMSLIEDLNTHTDLTVKLKSQSKILSFLNDANDGKQPNAPIVKDYKKEVGRAKSEFGKLGF